MSGLLPTNLFNDDDDLQRNFNCTNSRGFVRLVFITGGRIIDFYFDE